MIRALYSTSSFVHNVWQNIKEMKSIWVDPRNYKSMSK